MVPLRGDHYERGQKIKCQMKIALRTSSVFTKIARKKVPDEDRSSHVFRLHKDHKKEAENRRSPKTELRFSSLFSVSSLFEKETLTSLYTIGLEGERKK